MDTLHELLCEIIKNPNADHLRLMYADALDDRDNVQRMDAERAEFIRLQVALAKHPVRPVYDVDSVSVRNGLLHFYCEGVRRVQSGTRVDLRVLDAKRWERKSYHNVLVMEWFSDGIANARMDEHSVDDSDEVKGMREREGELLGGKCSYQWLGRESPWYTDFAISDRLVWKRGFIEEVRCPFTAFFAHTDDWLWEHNKMAACEKRWSVSLAHGGYIDRDTIATLRHRQRTEHPPECVCGGTLSIPIPCPMHAHPVRKVVLTGSWCGLGSLSNSPAAIRFGDVVRGDHSTDWIYDMGTIAAVRLIKEMYPTIQFEHKM